jgi:hypothetical protein
VYAFGESYVTLFIARAVQGVGSGTNFFAKMKSYLIYVNLKLALELVG